MSKRLTNLDVFAFPQINKPAPEFCALTTKGMKNLDDYKGKWLVIFSHLIDMIPACIEEFFSFVDNHKNFKEINTELLGLSINTCQNQIDLLNNIEDNFKINIPFPVIADLDLKVVHAYGVNLFEETDNAALRATFIIDDRGVLRAMLHYPMNSPRPIDEFIRLITAMQFSDKKDSSYQKEF